jgi:FtsP/CotA-like multicopper oxidase with cupredoxin domain
MHRRHFVQLAGAAGFTSLVRPSLLLGRDTIGAMRGAATLPRAPLVRPPVLRGSDLTLRAAERNVEIAPGAMARAWTPGDGPVGPTIEGRTGDRIRVRLDNALPEATILHWHGLRVPEAADGHPRLAIAPGAHYGYEIPLIDRAGTYWYHSHVHHRTGLQAYRGMAGMLIVRDDAEERLNLPHGAHELPMLIQDRRPAADGTFEYEPVMHEQMEGYFGDAPFVNGIRLPSQEVETTTYRLRIANGTTSRILRLALSNGRPFTLSGVDGGLLEAPVTLETIDLGTGERVDVLVSFANERVGSTVSLLSAAFPSPARMGGMGGMGMGRGRGRMGAAGVPQGGEMTLVEFRVTRAVTPAIWRPVPLP